MNITIRVVEPGQMRYQTVGDWQVNKKGNLDITVANSHDSATDFLVGIHEAIEAVLCIFHGVKPKDVDDFDVEWEKSPNDYAEPGDDPDAPYHKEHVLATNIERILAQAIPLEWHIHDENVTRADEEVERELARKETQD